MPSPRIKRRQLTTRNDALLSFSELGVGTAPLGNLYAPSTKAKRVQTLDAAWDVGCRLFDTAPLYGLWPRRDAAQWLPARASRDDTFVLSTKVGRLMRRLSARRSATGQGKFFDTPSRREVYDYSYDGVMRSLEFSFERLGVDRIDIVFCHDVDVFTHRLARRRSDRRIGEFMESGYRALERIARQPA